MIFIGIDPDLSGGIAALDASGAVVSVVAMPATEVDVLVALKFSDGARAVLERVSASPQMGTVSAFTFGRGFGGLRMALAAQMIPFDEVTPGKWQQVMGCRTGGDKNISKRRAQALFPSVKVTHKIADALLIAEYCRRLEVRA